MRLGGFSFDQDDFKVRYDCHLDQKPNNVSFAWRYSTNEKIMWTYDDPTVVYYKAKYAKDNGLAGVMAYSLRDDQMITKTDKKLTTTTVREHPSRTRRR